MFGVDECGIEVPGCRQDFSMWRVVGGFASDNYWSSSQNNTNNAWNQNFDNGNQNNDNKNNTLQVRPVRGFPRVYLCSGEGVSYLRLRLHHVGSG